MADRQKEHDKPENLVQPAELPTHVATSLEEEANSNNSLEGYAAMNGLNDQPVAEEIEKQEQRRSKTKGQGER